MKKKLYSSMLLLFSIFLINNSSLHAEETNVSIEESSAKTVVNVPDENLKKQINLELGHDETADITQADMESLWILNLSNAENEDFIEDLTGLEYAVNITRLSIDYTKVKDLTPISGMTNLTSLRIEGNGIEDLTPISGLTNLKELLIYEDNIKSFDSISGLKNLKDLNLSFTNLENLDSISGLTNLEYFYARDASIDDIKGLSSLTNLKELGLPDNNITDLAPISGLTNLTELDISGNELKDLTPISSLKNLTQLDISYNRIIDLSPLSNLEKLSRVSLGGNAITDFSIFKNKKLSMEDGGVGQYPYVYLKYNNIMDVPKAYKFTVKEINGKAHEFSVDLSGAKKGSNTFTLNYNAGNGYYGTMTVNLEVGNSSTIQINNPYKVYYLGDGYLSDEEILEYFNIKAYDKDGNDITDQIKVDSSKVNWNKAGIYDITLSIVNPDGTVTTKILKIEIKAGENPSKNLIQTGSTGIGFIVMSLIVALGVFFKKSILVK